MDHWSHEQILNMLEGGNSQLSGFFERHSLADSDKRYLTKAARFYQMGMKQHVAKLAMIGSYQGRDVSRGQQTSTTLTDAAPSSQETDVKRK
jgi:hypothetical protein